MSVQPIGVDGEGYCDPEDVIIYFDKLDSVDETTNPSREQVRRVILEKSDWIDDYTGHSWRDRQVVDEYHNLDGPYHWRTGMPISLQYRDIKTPLDSSKGDKLEFYRDSQEDNYKDWVTSSDRDEGRDGDYWIEESTGMLHVYARNIFFNRYREMRITYRFGQDTIPNGIRQACARLTAAEFMRSQMYRVTTPGNEETPEPTVLADRWEEMVMDRYLEQYKEVRSLGVS